MVFKSHRKTPPSYIDVENNLTSHDFILVNFPLQSVAVTQDKQQHIVLYDLRARALLPQRLVSRDAAI